MANHKYCSTDTDLGTTAADSCPQCLKCRRSIMRKQYSHEIISEVVTPSLQTTSTPNLTLFSRVVSVSTPRSCSFLYLHKCAMFRNSYRE